MIQSMTGYGNAVVSYKDKKIHVEIKSLNSKQLDREGEHGRCNPSECCTRGELLPPAEGRGPESGYP